MQVDIYRFPDDYYFDRHHFWAKIEGDTVVMGMTEYAIRMAGDLVFIETVEAGKKVQQDKAFMSVESGKWVGRVFAVVSGEIVAVNDELEFEPTIVNSDPYGAGWLVKIKPSNLAEEQAKLLTGETLRDWLEPEIERQKKLQAKKGV
jgi:Glycine cleavage system H protein (lipoate-binding)